MQITASKESSKQSSLFWDYLRRHISNTVNQQILAAIKFGVSQNKAIYVNLAAIKFGVSPRPVYAVYDRRMCWRRQILAKSRNSPNSPNIIARQNLLIYSNMTILQINYSVPRPLSRNHLYRS